MSDSLQSGGMMSDSLQLPTRRIVEGEVVNPVGEIKFNLELDFNPDDLRRFVEAMRQAKSSIEDAQRKGGVVSQVPAGNKMGECIDGEVINGVANRPRPD